MLSVQAGRVLCYQTVLTELLATILINETNHDYYSSNCDKGQHKVWLSTVLCMTLLIHPYMVLSSMQVHCLQVMILAYIYIWQLSRSRCHRQQQ